MEKIVSLVRPLAKAAGKLETRDAILQHYVQLGECVVGVTRITLGYRSCEHLRRTTLDECIVTQIALDYGTCERVCLTTYWEHP